MPLTLEELEKGAKRSRERSKSNILNKYHIARDLGFSSSEAVVLMGRSRETIRSLAVKKGFLKDGEGLPTPTKTKEV